MIAVTRAVFEIIDEILHRFQVQFPLMLQIELHINGQFIELLKEAVRGNIAAVEALFLHTLHHKKELDELALRHLQKPFAKTNWLRRIRQCYLILHSAEEHSHDARHPENQKDHPELIQAVGEERRLRHNKARWVV